MSLPTGLLPIARQIHAALLVEIDHEIEIERLVGDGRYARDVLLVCEACADPGLKRLAGEFRALVAAAKAAQVAPAPMAVPASMLERAMATATADAADSGPDARLGPASWTGPAALPEELRGRPAPAAPQRAAPAQADEARPGSWLQRLAGGWRRR